MINIELELEEESVNITHSNITTTISRTGMILSIDVRKKGSGYLLDRMIVPIQVSNNSDILEVLKIPFEDLDLSVRTFNCLKAAKIYSLSELVQYEQEDLMKFRNFGQKSICEVEEMLKERGLSLGMNIAELHYIKY